MLIRHKASVIIMPCKDSKDINTSFHKSKYVIFFGEHLENCLFYRLLLTN